MRSGTENVAGIAGMGAAAEFARLHLDSEVERLTGLREHLHTLLGKPKLHGHPQHRLPNTLNVQMSGVDGVAASSGSACHSGGPSPVLTAMGIKGPALRLSLGRTTTLDEIEAAAILLRAD